VYTNRQCGIMNSRIPPSPPPTATPHYSGRIANSIPGMLQNCLNSYVYIWTKNDGSFWMYPTSYISDHMLFGYQWDRGFWRYIDIDFRQIDSYF
jgi:hypothetical protein